MPPPQTWKAKHPIRPPFQPEEQGSHYEDPDRPGWTWCGPFQIGKKAPRTGVKCGLCATRYRSTLPGGTNQPTREQRHGSQSFKWNDPEELARIRGLLGIEHEPLPTGQPYTGDDDVPF